MHRSIERAAQHEAKRTEQKAKGQLERQKLQNEKVFSLHTYMDVLKPLPEYVYKIECACAY